MIYTTLYHHMPATQRTITMVHAVVEPWCWKQY